VLKLLVHPMSPASLPDWIESSTRHILTGPVSLVAAGLSARSVTDIQSCDLLPWRCARHRFLPAPEDFDHAHGAAAAGAWFAQYEVGDVWLSAVRLCLIWRLPPWEIFQRGPQEHQAAPSHPGPHRKIFTNPAVAFSRYMRTQLGVRFGSVTNDAAAQPDKLPLR